MIKSKAVEEYGKNRHPFRYIAFWQLLVFVMLLCLVWASELLDLSSVYFAASLSSTGLLKACVLSAGVLVCAFVMIGNTYLQQKRIVQGFIVICSYCKRVEIDHDAWEQVESYVSKHSRAVFSHGICPDCYVEVCAKEEASVKPV